MVYVGGCARLTQDAEAMAIDKQINRYEFMFPDKQKAANRRRTSKESTPDSWRAARSVLRNFLKVKFRRGDAARVFPAAMHLLADCQKNPCNRLYFHSL